MLADSLGRKTLVGLVATGGLLWFLEAQMFDSQNRAQPSTGDTTTTSLPSVGRVVTFTATAYCKGDVTSTGVAPQRGVAAADPSVLPMGSIVEVDVGDALLGGLYTVLDTGPKMRGRSIDLYVWSCTDALRFGRRTVQVTVLRRGWDPRSPSTR